MKTIFTTLLLIGSMGFLVLGCEPAPTDFEPAEETLEEGIEEGADERLE